MRGDPSFFAREDGVQAAWKIVDPILDDATPVHPYEPGTWGPAEADALIEGAEPGTLRPDRMSELRKRAAWSALERHFAEIGERHLRDLFADDPDRGERLTAQGAGLFLDYSKNRVTDETLGPAHRPGRAVGLAGRREAMFTRRAHQRLRGPRRPARRAPDAAATAR